MGDTQKLSPEEQIRFAREQFEAAAGLYERAGQPYWVQRTLAQAAAA